MPSVPRIRRAVVDSGQVYRPAQGIPVIATLEYPSLGSREEVEGTVIAWTRSAVELVWVWKGQQQADWIPAVNVRRR